MEYKQLLRITIIDKERERTRETDGYKGTTTSSYTFLKLTV
jgi:hypothetical protein